MKTQDNFSEQEMKKIMNPSSNDPFVLLESTLPFSEHNHSFLFHSFIDILTFSPGDRVDDFFDRIERYRLQGYWLCGFFSYEFGYFLERKLSDSPHQAYDYPLAWMGVCSTPQKYGHPIISDEEVNRSLPVDFHFTANITEEEYTNNIKMIKDYLERGETYQVNYTFKLKSQGFDCDPIFLYLLLRKSQQTSYSAFIHTGDNDFLSFSPELFFRLKDRKITTRPMKGTIKRGRFLHEDADQESVFADDLKVRAENLMIVDLLRNDLGKIAKKGTVKTSDLFTIEKYSTLYQMTSTISAHIPRGVSSQDLFNALFPSGSVTGAPKIRTMQIIRQLEKEPRGIYTGAIGYLGPEGEACFNVAIRTLAIDRSRKTCELGIGGGIVYDSIDIQEFKEALLKADFFLKPQPDFSLIEAIRWDNGYVFLDKHLARLKKSCLYFRIKYDEARLRRYLMQIGKTVPKGSVYKVRIQIDFLGNVSSGFEEVEESLPPVKIKISDKVTDPDVKFFYHKTTERKLYNEERRIALNEGFFDVIFFNKYGQLTEGAVSNVYIEKNNTVFTPPVTCGLLPGILREELITQGRVIEKVLLREDILSADKVYIGNSVRGLLPADISELSRSFL